LKDSYKTDRAAKRRKQHRNHDAEHARMVRNGRPKGMKRSTFRKLLKQVEARRPRPKPRIAFHRRVSKR